MKAIKKKYSVEAQVGVQLTLEEFLQEVGLDCFTLQGTEYHFEEDEITFKVGTKVVKPSDIKMEIRTNEEYLQELIVDTARTTNFTGDKK